MKILKSTFSLSLHLCIFQKNLKVKYSQTSVIERFCSRPNRFSNKKFEIFTIQTSNTNSDNDQTEQMQTDQLPTTIALTEVKTSHDDYDITQMIYYNSFAVLYFLYCFTINFCNSTAQYLNLY